MRQAAQAYSAVARTGLSTRQLEAEVLSRCARDLQVAAECITQDPGRLIDALERNRAAWSLLSIHLRRDDSDLPPATRESMLALARFVFDQIFQTCQTLDPVLIEPLVSINRALAAGLRGEAPGR